MTPNPQATKATINKWDCIKPERVCTAKETVNGAQRQPREWKKITAYHISDKGVTA